MSLFTAICVVELPALRGGASSATTASAPAARSPVPSTTSAVPGTFVLVLPHGDPSKLPRDTLSFCFPDSDNLAKMPYHYDNNVEEFAFTLTPRDAPRMNGYVRRYRVGGEAVGGRLDLTPYTSARTSDATAVPAFQAICILSERPYHRFFSQCLQLLHAARLAGGPAALSLARTLLAFNSAPTGAIIPLRSLINAPRVPGSLLLPKERLRVPVSVGLPFFDVPLSPLLYRLDAPALLMLYTAMLCDRRIIFVAQSMATLTSCVHAAIALMQPFEWLNIFIPVLPSPYLMYCTAPNPYIIGLTPAQFTQLNEEYEIGDIVLVALDEGYVACLNSALPLADMEGPGPGNNNTGYISYSGPKLNMTTTAATTAPPDASSSFMSYFSGSPGVTAGAPPTDGGSIASATVSASGSDASLSPFHAVARSHTYDEEFIRARQQRKAFAQRRLADRRRGKEMVNKLFNKDANVKGLADIRKKELARRAKTAVSAPATSDFDFSTGTFTGTETAPAKVAAGGWGTFKPDPMMVVASSAPANPMKAAVPISEGGAAHIAAAAVKAGPIVGGSQAMIPETELDGSLSNEIGIINLGVDLKALVSRPGDEDAIRKRKAAAARRIAAFPTELAGLDMAAMAAKRDNAKTLGQRLALGKMTAALFSLATGAPSTDDPGMQLALNVKKVYEKEKRDGWFDEAALYACILAFVTLVFGRVADYVHVDPDASKSVSRGPAIPGSDLKFAKEDFVKYTVKHPSIARLMDEAQHSQWLQTFAVEWHLKHAGPKKEEVPGKLNIVEMAMAEALLAATAGNPTGSIGRASSSLGSLGYGSSSNPLMSGSSTSSSMGASTGGPAALMGSAMNYSNIMKKLYGALLTVTETIADATPLGTGTGVAGTSHTVSSALSGLLYAASCVTAVAGRPPTMPPHLPDLSLPLVVTALRGLLSASTSATLAPEESHSQIVKIAAAATHDPILINVVLGVLWNRMNDCADRNWQHGYKALVLLYALLRVGSARVASISLSFLPLLRFLMHPARALAVRAGYVAEEMAGQAHHVYVAQAANVLSRARKGLFGPTAIPGLALSAASNPLSSISPQEGALMVARQASRLYLLLSHPRRLMLERAVAIGPSAIAFGAPMTLPLLYPLVHPSAIYATGDSALPPGWLPTPKDPLPPVSEVDAARKADEPQKQARAADAPWEQVHRVATPCMASLRSNALKTVGTQFGVPVSKCLETPETVMEAIKNARERKAMENPATMAAQTGKAGAPARPRRMKDALVLLSRTSFLPANVHRGPVSASPYRPPAFSASFDVPSPVPPAPQTASAFPDHPAFSFDGEVGSSMPQVVPSSEFDVFGPPATAASVIVQTSEFDSWTQNSRDHAPIPTTNSAVAPVAATSADNSDPNPEPTPTFSADANPFGAFSTPLAEVASSPAVDEFGFPILQGAAIPKANPDDPFAF